MGKQKRQRNKLHTAAVRSSSEQSVTVDEGMQVDQPTFHKPGSQMPPHDGGVFSKLDIDLDMLTKTLNQSSAMGGDNLDARSSVTGKSLKGLGLKKKEKQQLRHDIWLKKVNIMEERRKEEKERKRRQKTAVVGDMRPLFDTLPTLDLLLKSTAGSRSTSYSSSSKKTSNPRKVRGIEKESFQKKQMLEGISSFHAVLQHPSYQSNPLGTIVEHLTNKMKHENNLK